MPDTGKAWKHFHKGVSLAVNGSFTLGFDQYKNKVDLWKIAVKRSESGALRDNFNKMVTIMNCSLTQCRQ